MAFKRGYSVTVTKFQNYTATQIFYVKSMLVILKLEKTDWHFTFLQDWHGVGRCEYL